MSKDDETETFEKKLYEIDLFFAQQLTPQNFDQQSQENSVLRMDIYFESLCAVLESNGVSSPQELTTLQFYSRLEYFKRANKAKSST